MKTPSEEPFVSHSESYLGALVGGRVLVPPATAEARLRADAACQLDRVRTLEQTCAGLEQAVAERTREVDEANARLRLVAHESAHRFGNLLATIQAVARKTARGAPTVDGFVEALVGRLSSMGLAIRQVMIDDGATSVDFARIVETQLAIYRDSYPGQIETTGPIVPMRPDSARMVGLAIHELATNAVKHGALSEPGGRVDVSWSVSRQREDEILDFRWRERSAGGAARPAPSRQGFGTLLLCGAAPAQLRGTAVLDFSGEGLAYRLEVPVP